jgi:hypothetical protein
MRRSLVSAGVLVLLGLFAGAGVCFSQDFQKTYVLGAGGHIRIGNVSGDVKVTGYNGDTVVVAGYKQGRDRDLVKVEDQSSADRVDIRVKYPENCNCDASINFEVRVPQSVEFNFDRISSVSGEVEMRGVTGRVRAESVSGNVEVVDVSGIVSASSVSGNVNAALNRIVGSGDMKFSSVSGNVTVKAPANLDADVEMSSVSGGLKTDFPIEVQEPRYGPGRSARGRLGSGTSSLRVTTVSGRVLLGRI